MWYREERERGVRKQEEEEEKDKLKKKEGKTGIACSWVLIQGLHPLKSGAFIF